MRAKRLLAISAAALAACGGDSVEPFTTIYKYTGSVQCSGGGTSVAEMQRQLGVAGVFVMHTSCGFDGRVYPAVCGAPDGRIVIFDIPSAQLPVAKVLGYDPLSDLPSASKAACPPGA